VDQSNQNQHSQLLSTPVGTQQQPRRRRRRQLGQQLDRATPKDNSDTSRDATIPLVSALPERDSDTSDSSPVSALPLGDSDPSPAIETAMDPDTEKDKVTVHYNTRMPC